MFTILIVDDNIYGLRALKMALQNKNYQLHSARSGTDALKLTQQVNPDLILLDIKMPDIDGFEVCKRLKASEATADIPIIFLSALDEEVNKLEGLTIGGEDYITKPFSPDEVAARVRIHLALRAKQKELESLRAQEKHYFTHINATRDDILDQLRHDLKSPLASIKTSAYLIKQLVRMQPSRVETYTERIDHAVDETFKIMEWLLNIIRLESGQNVQFEVVELTPFILGITDAYRTLAEAKDIQFLIQIQAEPRATAYFDPNQMQSVISNLLSNALKYTTSLGKVRLRVSLDSQYLSIEVSDTGRGIPEQHLCTIFNRTYRVPEAGISTEGAGLGLYIVKSIVERHKGKIHVQSKPQLGSTFTVSIPQTQMAGV